MYKFIVVISFLVIGFSLSAQVYVADTFNLQIKSIPVKSFTDLNIRCGDERQVQGRNIASFERKKWLFFPVDQIVNLNQPLAYYFSTESNGSGDKYFVTVHQFSMSHASSFRKNMYGLDASLQLHKISAQNDTIAMGVFYYEESYSYAKKKDSLLTGYQKSFEAFNAGFSYDLQQAVEHYTIDDCSQFNFRKMKTVSPPNFYVQATAFAGIGFWGMDGEVWFSNPEPFRKFKRKSSLIRYLHYKNRQSVALGRKYAHWNYRVNEDWLFTNKQTFLLGFNRWEDIREQKRTFEEIFLFQLSANQMIMYNGLDKKGLVFGLGLMEAFSYVIYNDVMIDFGVSMHLGYKF
jgi:hypothetical protein